MLGTAIVLFLAAAILGGIVLSAILKTNLPPNPSRLYTAAWPASACSWRSPFSLLAK